jgi:SSS family solute:Na+ symporter
MFSIIPIWFIGMTLYQRIYASRDIKTAKRAWLIAGIFEYPVMAFMGVILGMFARVALESGMFEGYTIVGFDKEMGLPMLLKHVLPVGFMGIVLSAYFSAIMSTADSCLMAASGNLLTDVFKKHESRNGLRYSQLFTLGVGILALLLALTMEDVLELMLYSYGFMVSGMLVPVLAALFSKSPNSIAAMASMIIGGTITVVLNAFKIPLPLSLDPNIFGITASFLVYLLVSHIFRKNEFLQISGSA